jgi:hypothetical protein
MCIGGADLVDEVDKREEELVLPSVVRSKPAIRGHFKTGHMARDLDVVLCRSLSLQV